MPRTESEAQLLKELKSLKNPEGIQRFLDSIPYHLANTSWSPLRVLRERQAHCLEGATFAAAALRAIGRPPLILDLEAVQDTDHVIAVFKERGFWGAIAASNYSGCRFRAPVYRTLRELALSYFEDYFNLRRERTLRAFSRPVNLSRFDQRQWMTSGKDIWFVAEHLLEIPHTPLFSMSHGRRLPRVDMRSYRAGLLGRHLK